MPLLVIIVAIVGILIFWGIFKSIFQLFFYLTLPITNTLILRPVAKRKIQEYEQEIARLKREIQGM